MGTTRRTETDNENMRAQMRTTKRRLKVEQVLQIVMKTYHDSERLCEHSERYSLDEGPGFEEARPHPCGNHPLEELNDGGSDLVCVVVLTIVHGWG